MLSVAQLTVILSFVSTRRKYYDIDLDLLEYSLLRSADQEKHIKEKDQYFTKIKQASSASQMLGK